MNRRSFFGAILGVVTAVAGFATTRKAKPETPAHSIEWDGLRIMHANDGEVLRVHNLKHGHFKIIGLETWTLSEA